ncbi:MAG: ABC transporter permease [Lachnospiraceae bacterium]|nr:ABC transporter permease [Lachnospiraceae bacterium]
MKKTIIKNAVLRKDMLLDMKKPKVAVIMLLFNVLLGLVSLPFLGSTLLLAEGYSYGAADLSYRTMINMFLVLVWLETIAIFFLTPALTAGCVSIEKERQTMDVLLTTRMSTWQIILGKYFSSIMLVIMLLISGLPVMSLVFIYGGVSLWQLFLILLVLIATTMFLASFGVFFSALVKNTIVSVILTYIFLGVLLSATFSVSLFGIGIMENIRDTLEWEYNITTNINGDGFIFALWLNPFVTIFDSTAQIFGYGDEYLTINGMVTLGEEGVFYSMTEKNIFLNLWSLCSVIVQLLIAFLLLRWSAHLIKPVKRKPKKFKSNLNGVKRSNKAPVANKEATTEAMPRTVAAAEPVAAAVSLNKPEPVAKAVPKDETVAEPVEAVTLKEENKAASVEAVMPKAETTLEVVSEASVPDKGTDSDAGNEQ